MAWEYLPQADERFKVVAEYLKGRTKDKVIVDLNCLEARLTRFIEPDFAKYKGNDVQDKFPVLSKGEFVIARDDQFVQNLYRCDILIAAGIGGYEISRHPLESPTSTASTKFIIRNLQPEIIVLEAIQDFECIIKDIESEAKKFWYKVTLKKYLDLGVSGLLKRVVYIYEHDIEGGF